MRTLPVRLTLGTLFAASAAASAAAAGANAVPPPAEQIAAAVQAAPEEWRAAAEVLGYDAAGKLHVLRPGTNQLVCLADDPADEAFSVACYDKSLEPFMARGRELRAQGVSGADRVHRRWREIAAGKLAMPTMGTLFVLDGTRYDVVSGKVVDPDQRFVVYVPNATVESTGLPDHPVGPGAPWLMFAGTPGAHIMIDPPPPETTPSLPPRRR
jgi:hypothetical protein